MAEAAAPPVSSTTENDTECSICHELFKEPKLLPCAHVLCRDCLLSWLSTNQEAVCPLCRCPVICGVKVTGPAEWKTVVDALPDDVIMSALVESARVLNMDHTCIVCQAPAISVCIDCMEMMCQACETVHIKFTVSRHHKFESLSSMSAERLASSQPVYCTAHAGKAAELFCPAHNAVICHVCASAKHRSCSDVTEVTDVADKSRRDLTAFVKKLEAGEKSLEKVVKKLDSLLEEVDKNYEKSVADINAKCDDMERSVKACRQRMKDKALDAKVKSRDSILTAKGRVTRQTGVLTSHRSLSDRVNKASTAASMTNATALLKQRAPSLDADSKLPSLVRDVTLTKLTIDAAVVTEVKQKLQGLGTAKSSHPHFEFEGWHFHTKHGTKVFLFNEGYSARRADGGHSDGIVISSLPMQVNMVYEVCLDKVYSDRQVYYFPFGVTLQNPDVLTLCSTAYSCDTTVTWCYGRSPYNEVFHSAVTRFSPASNGWDSAVVLSKGVHKQGREVASDIPEGINSNLKEGQCVGLLLDDNNALHLYIDGVDRGVIVDNIAQPCYPFFELSGWYPQISALPARPIPASQIRSSSRPHAGPENTGNVLLHGSAEVPKTKYLLRKEKRLTKKERKREQREERARERERREESSDS